MTKNVEYTFMFIDHVYILFGEMFTQIFCPFEIEFSINVKNNKS